jgi:hypothetical protein
VVKKLDEPWVSSADMGSFDFVRLAPHFAQDDRVDWIIIKEECDDDGEMVGEDGDSGGEGGSVDECAKE